MRNGALLKVTEIWESPTGEIRCFAPGAPVEIHCRGGRVIGGHKLVSRASPVDLTGAQLLAHVRASRPKEPT